MKTVIFSIFFISSIATFGQVLKFDQLEMYYDQGHFKSVYRKSKRLLDNPEYDYSKTPAFYKAISSFQLARNNRWRNRHPDCLSIASGLMVDILKSPNGQNLMNIHSFEMSTLKKDLISWAEDLKIQEEIELFNQVNAILETYFDKTKNFYENTFDKTPSKEITVTKLNLSKNREKALELAEKQLGVPYVWAGKSSDGFDCSGFTSYVLESQNISPPRRATDQKSAAKKVKRKDVQPGDLVFFDSGSGISHVGIVFSLQNNSIQMIHASSSKGISIVDIYASNYWSQRIDSFGTFF